MVKSENKPRSYGTDFSNILAQKTLQAKAIKQQKYT